MQPLILAEQTPQVVADFLEATFPATTLGFEDIMARFLAEPGSGQGALCHRRPAVPQANR